ncbi:MAG: hypothetical protein IKG93_13215 [Clostridiales bacterium]|nr:hypothetical protein [Clostridiales bacterium]
MIKEAIHSKQFRPVKWMCILFLLISLGISGLQIWVLHQKIDPELEEQLAAKCQEVYGFMIYDQQYEIAFPGKSYISEASQAFYATDIQKENPDLENVSISEATMKSPSSGSDPLKIYLMKDNDGDFMMWENNRVYCKLINPLFMYDVPPELASRQGLEEHLVEGGVLYYSNQFADIVDTDLQKKILSALREESGTSGSYKDYLFQTIGIPTTSGRDFKAAVLLDTSPVRALWKERSVKAVLSALITDAAVTVLMVAVGILIYRKEKKRGLVKITAEESGLEQDHRSDVFLRTIDDAESSLGPSAYLDNIREEWQKLLANPQKLGTAVPGETEVQK